MKSLATCMVSMFGGLLCFALLSGTATQAYAQTQPTVSFASWVTRAGEGPGQRNVEVGVRLNPAPTTAITIKYHVWGIATPGSDYAALSGTVAVPKGATTATIPVTVIDDTLKERTEVFFLRLVKDASYRLGQGFENPNTHYLYISDNDTPYVSLRIGGAESGRGGRYAQCRGEGGQGPDLRHGDHLPGGGHCDPRFGLFDPRGCAGGDSRPGDLADAKGVLITLESK